MSYQVTNLKKMSLPEISGTDFLIITDITSSNNKIETKKISISDTIDYIVTSSNVENIFRTGSFIGNFFGIFSGSGNSSSISISSSNSIFTNHLLYSTNNGTSSNSVKSKYSFNSDISNYVLSSSLSVNSLYSKSSSYFYNNNQLINRKFTDTSDVSNTSKTSLLSQKTLYITPSVNNGIVYHSIYSDKSAKSNKANRLSDTNVAIVDKSIKSDSSKLANTSSFAPNSFYSNQTYKAQRILSGNNDCWAHCSFKIDENLKIVPLTWNNISSIKLILNPADFPGPQIIITYENSAPKNISLTAKCSNSPFTPVPIDYSLSESEIINEVITKAPSTTIDPNAGTYFPYYMYAWASSCSSVSARISIFAQKINWSNWYTTETGFFGEDVKDERTVYSEDLDETLYIKNCIFSFAAFPSPSYTQSEISGSTVEEPPSTMPTKC